MPKDNVVIRIRYRDIANAGKKGASATGRIISDKRNQLKRVS